MREGGDWSHSLKAEEGVVCESRGWEGGMGWSYCEWGGGVEVGAWVSAWVSVEPWWGWVSHEEG